MGPLPPLPSPLGPCSFNTLGEEFAGEPKVPGLSFLILSPLSAGEQREKGAQSEIHHGLSLSTKKATL